MPVLLTGVLMGALDISLVGPAIPAIEKTIHLDGNDISWIFSIYLIFYIFGIPILSKLSDINGRKSIYILSVSVFAIGSLIVAGSTNVTSLLAGRGIQGFGASGIFPVAAATIGDLYPAAKRGRALGLLGGVYGIAFIVGPVLAGTILHFLNWQSIFIINIPIALLLIIFSYRILPGKPQTEITSFNLKGIVILVVVLMAYSIGMNNIIPGQPYYSLNQLTVWPFLLIAFIGLPILIIHEKNQKNPYVHIDIFNSKQLRLTGLISIGLGLFQSSIVFIPKLAVGLFELSPSEASFALLPLVIATAIVPPVSGRLLEVVGSRVIIFTGLLLAVVSLATFSLLSTEIWLFYLAGAGLGCGLAIRASLKFILLNETGHKNRASALGMLIILITVGQLTGAAIIGSIISVYDRIEGFGKAFYIFTFVTILLLVISLFLKKKKVEFDSF